MDRKEQIKICLDEIDASIVHLEGGKLNKEGISKHKGWIRKHKAILKDLKYKGKMPRIGRIRGGV